VARTFGDDFDAQVSWAALSGWTAKGTGTLETTGGRTGSVKHVASNAGAQAILRYATGANTANFTAGFYFKIVSLPGADQVIAGLLASPSTAVLYVRITSTGALKVTNASLSATYITTSAGAITAGTWHYIEVTATAGTGTGTAEVFVDGVSAGTTSGRTFGNLGAFVIYSHAGNVAFDDVYLRNDLSYEGPPGGISITGTGAAAGPSGVADGDGSVTIPGVGAATGPPPTASGAGTVTTTGTGAATGPAGVADGLGTVDGTILGIGAATGPSGVADGAGTVTTTGAGTATGPVGTADGEGDNGDDATTGVGVATGPSGVAAGVGINSAPPITTARCHTPMGALAIALLVAVDPLPTVEPIRRTSHVMANLTASHPIHARRGCAFGDTTVIRSTIGHLQLFISGRNVTYWRDAPVTIRRYESETPIGDTAAAFELPQKNPWDKDGEADLDFLRPDAPVVIALNRQTGEDTYVMQRLWSGFLDARGNGLVGENEDYAYEAKGTLTAALHAIHEPTPFTTPTDIWVLAARALNKVVGKRWADIPETPIGIPTLTRGSRDDKVWDYVQALLGEAITDDGRQWTISEVAPGIIRPVLKPAASQIHATVAYGTPGVDIDLRVDESTRVDGYYVSGIAPDGGGWANIFFPGLELVNPPPYPNDDASNMHVGDDDSDTDSGSGVSDFQRRVNEVGIVGQHTVSGTFTAGWYDIIYDLQDRIGIEADGVPGPQTWNALHDRAGAGIKIEPLRLPLVVKPNSWPTLHSATGTVIGKNPDFDDTRVPRFLPLQLGARKTKTEGARIAQALLDIYGQAGAFGQAVFEMDPNDTDRAALSHLSNIKITGHESTDRVLQASHKVVTIDDGEDGSAFTVTLDLDEHARDAMWVEDLLEQRRNATPDLTRRPTAGARSSRIVTDERGPWDSESPCGHLRRTAINGAAGLPSIITVPFAEVGKLAAIELRATQPFAFAILASLRLTENQALSIVGDPFSSDDPWRPVYDQLEPYGIIEAWGEQDNACGFSPGTEDADYPFTGLFKLNTPLDYWTETPHLASILIFMRGASGFIEGRFLPAYEGS
jgi:hypothetical protein